MALPLALAIGGSALLGAGASIYGANKASDAATAGNALASGTPSAGAALQAQMLQQPYSDLGYNALAPYQWLTTGTKPQVEWSASDEARYQALAPQANYFASQYETLMGPGSMRSNYRNVRSAQTQALNYKAQLDELNQLRTRRQQYNALQAGGMNGSIQDYLEQDPRYKAMMTSGQRAMDRYGAAKGTLGYHGPSSGQLIRNFDLGSNVASTTYSNKLNDLMNAINVGRGASSTQGSYGVQGANAIGSTMQNLGQNVTAAGQQEGANWANLGQIPMNALSSYNNYQQNQQYLNNMNAGSYAGMQSPFMGNSLQPIPQGGGPLMSYGN